MKTASSYASFHGAFYFHNYTLPLYRVMWSSLRDVFSKNKHYLVSGIIFLNYFRIYTLYTIEIIWGYDNMSVAYTWRDRSKRLQINPDHISQ